MRIEGVCQVTVTDRGPHKIILKIKLKSKSATETEEWDILRTSIQM